MTTDTLANALERWLKNYDPEDFGCACMPDATCSTCRWRERIKPLQDALADHRASEMDRPTTDAEQVAMRRLHAPRKR